MTVANDDPAGGRLWHYTDAAGLFGIVASRQLRFGDTAFLNDRTERVYGNEYVTAILRELEASDTTGMMTEVREEFAFRSVDHVYACSFSETNNSLGQWERYGARGEGYCIGFDVSRLDSALDPERVPRIAMMYDPDDQRRAVIDAATEAAGLYGHIGSQIAPEQPEGVFNALPAPGDLGGLTFRLKNPDFREEREWRYFVDVYDWSGEDVEEDLAVRGNYIKPFIALPKKSKFQPLPPLPIVAVVCGPRLDVELAKPSVERLLKLHGYENVAVEPSALAKSWR